MKLACYLPRFRAAYRAQAELAARESWSRGELEQFQLERLNQLWRHAVVHVPYYQQLAAARDLPDQFSDWPSFRAAVPILDKPTVKREPRDFVSQQTAPGKWHRTGGSTGTPMDAYWSQAAHREMLQLKYRAYQRWGVDIFDPTVFLWGHSNSLQPGWRGTLARYRQPLEDWLRNRLRLSAYRMGAADLRGYLPRIQKFRPAAMYGYSSILRLLALEMERAEIRLPGLKAVVVTGEPTSPETAADLQRVFAAPIVIEYGSIECGQIAHLDTDGTLRVHDDAVYVETEPRRDGRFDILVSVLNNSSFPLLRYRLGDVTDQPITRPPSGMGILANVSGRSNDLLIGRQGAVLHSARLDAFFKYECAGLRRFRVHQQADGALHVLLELDEHAGSLDTAALSAQLEQLVEGFPAEVSIVDELPATSAGKHRLVISDRPLPETAAREPAR